AAIDPPDPDFQKIAPLIIPGHPTDGLLISRLKWLHRTVRNIDSAISLSEDRMLGAELAGDTDWVIIHKTRIADLASFKAVLLTRTMAMEKLTVSWRNELDDLDFSSQTSEEVNQKIDEILDAIELPSASRDFISFVLKDGVSSSLGPTPDFVMNTVPIETALASLQAITALCDSVGLQLATTNSQPTPVDPIVLTEIQEKREKIFDLIQNSIVGEDTLFEIEHYILRVQELLKNTRNIDALADHLEFGFAALTLLQDRTKSPSEVMKKIREFENAGMLSTQVADQWIEDLESIESKIQIGEFEDTYADLSTLSRLVSSEMVPVVSNYISGLADVFRKASRNVIVNAENPFDTNDDGDVSPLDVLVLVNYLNLTPTFAFGSVSDQYMLDADNDNSVSPLDVLMVINFLNYRTNGDGENDVTDSIVTGAIPLWTVKTDISQFQLQERLAAIEEHRTAIADFENSLQYIKMKSSSVDNLPIHERLFRSRKSMTKENSKDSKEFVDEFFSEYLLSMCL
ncbi:MAG: hypothetical protein KGQ60_15860, partial [Planctomycetes bacterium]|nr:hypothetical protein [Planctomycetota bacterium]